MCGWSLLDGLARFQALTTVSRPLRAFLRQASFRCAPSFLFGVHQGGTLLSWQCVPSFTMNCQSSKENTHSSTCLLLTTAVRVCQSAPGCFLSSDSRLGPVLGKKYSKGKTHKTPFLDTPPWRR